MSKPAVAVYKFSSCDGCQLSILNLEDELLDLGGVVDIAYFLEARRQTSPGPYDIALVEGAIAENVKVDYELGGCPVNKYQLVEVIQALLQKRRPNLPTHSICLDCKRKGIPCVIVAQGIPCLGPATRTGCGVLCPASGRGCYGCFGPAPNQDMKSVLATPAPVERYPGEVRSLFSNISNYAPAFRLAAETLVTQSNQITGEKK